MASIPGSEDPSQRPAHESTHPVQEPITIGSIALGEPLSDGLPYESEDHPIARYMTVADYVRRCVLDQFAPPETVKDQIEQPAFLAADDPIDLRFLGIGMDCIAVYDPATGKVIKTTTPITGRTKQSLEKFVGNVREASQRTSELSDIGAEVVWTDSERGIIVEELIDGTSLDKLTPEDRARIDGNMLRQLVGSLVAGLNAGVFYDMKADNFYLRNEPDKGILVTDLYLLSDDTSSNSYQSVQTTLTTLSNVLRSIGMNAKGGYKDDPANRPILVMYRDIVSELNGISDEDRGDIVGWINLVIANCSE